MVKQTANRKDIARKISEATGYYIKDIEEILEAESQAITELIEEGYPKVKNHKFMQIEVIERNSKKAWNGLKKEYYNLPSKKVLKLKPLTQLEKVEETINQVDE